MRVLVTGHLGYIGSVLAPLARAAGHDVVGLDTVPLPRLRLRRRAGTALPGAQRRPRRRAGRARGLRRDRPPRRALERPARGPRPGSDGRDQRGGHAAPGARGARGGRPPLRLRVLVLDVRRRGHRRRPRRDCAAAAADRLRRVEGARGGGAVRARGARLRAGLDAQRDRLRRLAASPARHRAQQPRRLGPHHRPHPAAERRHGVAPARARARRREDGARPARCARGADPRARHSTSAPTTRTTSSANSPRSLRR